MGGFTADGGNSARVDAYSIANNRWRRLPDLPVAVDHAAAASANGRVYIVGGYGGDRAPLDTAFVLENGSWRRLAPLPDGRAAAAAAIAGGKLYVLGGIDGRRSLARIAFALDLRTGRWARLAGPSPREHLAAAAAGTRVFALGGRSAGIDTNTARFESYDSRTRRWTTLAPVPAGARRHRRRVRERPDRLDRRRAARRERSAPSTPTSSARSAGAGSPTSRRRGTASAWSRTEAASTPSPAGRSPGLTVSGAVESLQVP